MNSYFKKYLQTFLLTIDLMIIFFIINFDFTTIKISTFEANKSINYPIAILVWIIVSFIMGTYSLTAIINFNLFNKKTIYTFFGWLFFFILLNQNELNNVTFFSNQLLILIFLLSKKKLN